MYLVKSFKIKVLQTILYNISLSTKSRISVKTLIKFLHNHVSVVSPSRGLTHIILGDLVVLIP